MATNLPIVLAHGIARFDFLLNHFTKQLSLFGLNLDPPTDGINYFKGIARHLRAKHFKVEHSSVSFAAASSSARPISRARSNVCCRLTARRRYISSRTAWAASTRAT